MPISYVFAGEPENGTSGDDFVLGIGATTGTDNNTINAGDGDDLVLGDIGNLWIPDESYHNDSIANAFSLEEAADTWTTSENPMFANWAIPHATVIAEATIGEPEYYSVAVGNGETLTVDIDLGSSNVGVGADLVVEIRDGSGNILASGDNSLTTDGGAGSVSALDPYLSFTAPSAGTYYISVHPAGSSTFTDNNTYVMNVSVTGHATEAATVQGADTIDGGAGDDFIFGQGGADTLNGGDGNDYLSGGTGNDTLMGGIGVDVLDGGAGNDMLNGGLGSDTASFASADAFVVVTLATQGVAQNTREGMDTLVSIERLIGSNFNDLLYGGNGNDRLEGGLGNDFMVGGAGNDTFFGGDGDDRMEGGAGDDILNGNTGRDTAIYTSATAGVTVNLGITTAQNTIGAGNDTLNSIERLIGSNFDDTLTGNTSNNVIYGQDGNDVIFGDAGSDVIYGGAGNDILTGGLGQDSFMFDTALNALTNVDQIQDFRVHYDKIRLDSSIFTQAGALGTLDANAFHAGLTAADASDRIIYDSTTGNIYYDADGDGAGAQVLFAHVTAGTALTNADIIII
jgi:Ca2+-binding RTX toxin-like protein